VERAMPAAPALAARTARPALTAMTVAGLAPPARAVRGCRPAQSRSVLQGASVSFLRSCPKSNEDWLLPGKLFVPVAASRDECSISMLSRTRMPEAIKIKRLLEPPSE